MNSYRLIAFDMDGTLLNSEKKISASTLDRIEKAFDAGKEIVLSTGRCLPELEEYIRQIPRLRFLICMSGALVYDRKSDRALYEGRIPVSTVEQILEISSGEDAMVHILTERSLVQRDQAACMEHYRMGRYQAMFDRVADMVEDIRDYYHMHPAPAYKLNLYHATAEGRERSRERLQSLGLEMADSEETSLECSAPGVTKGTGLRKLCGALGIPLEQTIAVGDADNDMDVLRTAGLSIAMGNAASAVKAVCDVTVSDCDHDGCVEAMEKYLL